MQLAIEARSFRAYCSLPRWKLSRRVCLNGVAVEILRDDCPQVRFWEITPHNRLWLPAITWRYSPQTGQARNLAPLPGSGEKRTYHTSNADAVMMDGPGGSSGAIDQQSSN
jgi:hypothetical protein